MKRTSMQRQAGFGFHAVLALVAVFGIIGLCGFLVYQRSQQPAGTTGSVVLQPDIPATISSKADLEKTEQALSKTDGKLDSDLGTSGLEADIKGLL